MSINSLLKQNGMKLLNVNENNKINDENTLYNPDIPKDMSGTKYNKGSNAYNKIKESDKYLVFNNQRFDKLKKVPLNGDFLTIKYNKNYGNKSYNQQLEGAINPENIRRKIDPLHAPPYDYNTGAEGIDFRILPSSTYKATNSLDLINKARASYASRLSYLGNLPIMQMNFIPVYNTPSK